MKTRYFWLILISLLVASSAIAIVQLGLSSAQPSEDQTQLSPVTPSVVTETDLDTQDINLPEANLNESLSPAAFENLTEQDGQLIITGRGQASAIVTIINNQKAILQSQVDRQGRWSAVIPARNNEIMDLSLRMLSEGGQSIPSDEVLFRVPLPPNTASEVALREPPPAWVLQTRSGRPSRIISSPFGALPSDGPFTLGPIDYDDLGAVIFTGTSRMPGRVRIYVDGNVIGDTQVQANGKWTYIRSDTLSVGRHDIVVELTSEGEAVARVAVVLRRLSPEMAQSADELFVHFEKMQWQLRRGLPGGGAQYTAIFAPNSEAALPVPGQN